MGRGRSHSWDTTWSLWKVSRTATPCRKSDFPQATPIKWVSLHTHSHHVRLWYDGLCHVKQSHASHLWLTSWLPSATLSPTHGSSLKLWLDSCLFYILASINCPHHKKGKAHLCLLMKTNDSVLHLFLWCSLQDLTEMQHKQTTQTNWPFSIRPWPNVILCTGWFVQ